MLPQVLPAYEETVEYVEDASQSQRERAEAAAEQRARAETEAGVWRQAHASAAAKALGLEEEAGVREPSSSDQSRQPGCVVRRSAARRALCGA